MTTQSVINYDTVDYRALLRAWNTVGLKLAVILLLAALHQKVQVYMECFRVVVVARMAELVKKDKLAQMLR